MTASQASATRRQRPRGGRLATRNAGGDDSQGGPSDRADLDPQAGATPGQAFPACTVLGITPFDSRRLRALRHRRIECPARVRDRRGPRAAAPRPLPCDAPGHRGAPPLTTAPRASRRGAWISPAGPRDGDRSVRARRAPEVVAWACVGVLPRAGAGPAAVGSPDVHEAAAGRVGAPACRDFRRPGHASRELRLRRRDRRHKQVFHTRIAASRQCRDTAGGRSAGGRVREPSPRLPTPPALPARTDGKYEPFVSSPTLSVTQSPRTARHTRALGMILAPTGRYETWLSCRSTARSCRVAACADGQPSPAPRSA
jgi:hypothetical protein